MKKLFKKNKNNSFNRLSKDSYAYIKYIKPAHDMEKQRKRNIKVTWFKEHALELILGVMGIILGILSLVMK
jgi:hypothetical protein